MSADGKLGVAFTSTYASIGVAPHKAGTRAEESNGNVYEFARAASAVTQYDLVAFVIGSASTDYNVVPATTTNAATAAKLGIAQTSIASAAYGWVALEGNTLQVNALVACQPAVTLYTTATAGSVDDAAVSGAAIIGLIALTSATSASSVACVANRMSLGAIPDA